MLQKIIFITLFLLYSIIAVQSTWCDRVSAPYDIPYGEELSLCSQDLYGPINVTASFALNTNDNVKILMGYYYNNGGSCSATDGNLEVVLSGSVAGDYVQTYYVPSGYLPAIVIECFSFGGCDTTISGNFCESSSNTIRASLVMIVIGTIISLIL